MIGDFNFQKLIVYRKSLDLAIELTKKAVNFQVKFQRIADQLIGASISVPLNIAEANGRISSKDKINFYKNARGSAFEIVPLIEICYSLNLFNKKEMDKYSSLTIEISKMLSSLIKSTGY